MTLPSCDTAILRTEADAPVSTSPQAYLVSVVNLAFDSAAVSRIERILEKDIPFGADVAGAMHHPVDQNRVVTLDVALPL